MVMDHHSHFLPHNNHHHHHNQRARYGPLPSPHHPQPRPRFPDDPSFNNPLPHRLPPPPPPAPALPPPPRPPQLSYRTIHTPPPPYNPPPHQSQFPFNNTTPNYANHRRHHHHPVEEDHRRISNSHHLHHGFPVSQRLSNRILVEETHTRRNLPDFDCISSWNPPRVVSDNNRPSRPYPPVDFDRELHQRPLDHATVSPYPPIDNPRYDPEGGSSRLRMERVDAYESNAREEFVWGRGDGNYHRRGDFAMNLDASSGGFGVASSQSALSREIDVDSSKSGGYVHQVFGVECDGEISKSGRRDGHGESKRWVNDRKGGPRDLDDSSFELGKNNEIGAAAAGDGGDFRIMSGKGEYYCSEMGRYNNRVNRECGHEFTRTPKKQIQKKSALLRIQTVKPNHRNREIEHLRYTGYAADSNSNFFRGKDQHGYLGYGMKSEEREGSPVEFDISFESNSLVAKAIVAPSSSVSVLDTNMTPVSDTDLTSTEKNKKVLVSDSDCSGFQLAQPSTGAVSLNSSPCKANDSSSSGKDLNLQKNVSDTCSQPCSSSTHNPDGKNEVALSDEITNTPAGKTSPRVAKKKRIVKKVVKKVVVNHNSTMSSSPSTNVPHGNAQADSVTLSSTIASSPDKIETSLMEKSTTVDKVSMLDCLHSIPNEGNLLPEDEKGDVSMLSLRPHSRSQECKTNEDSDTGKVASFERDGNISNSPSCASSNEDKKSDSDCLDAKNSVHGLPSLPNTDKVAKSLNGSTVSDINHMNHVNKQLCENEVPLSPGKYSDIGCPQNRHHVGDEMNCRLLSSTDNIINTDHINTCNSANDRVSGLSSDNLTGKLEEKFSVSDSGNNGVVGKVYCENKVPTMTQNVVLEDNPDTTMLVPSNGMVALSSSGKTRIQDGPDCLLHASVLKLGSYNGPTNSEDSITVPCCGIMNNAGNQVSPSNVTVSPGNCDTETFPKYNISVGFDEGDKNKIKKRKVGTHLNFSSSKTEGISTDPLNPVAHANVVDTTSRLSLKDPSPSQVLDQSVQSLDFSSQSSIDGVAAIHGKRELSEAEFFVGNNSNTDANKFSPISKRKKVTASHPNFTQCQSEFIDAIAVTTSFVECPMSFSDNQTHQKEVALSSMGIVSTAQSVPYPEDIALLSDNILVGGSFESMDANRETMSPERLELQHSGITSYSHLEDLAIQNVQFSTLEGEQKENATPVVPISNTQTDILVIGNTKGENIDLQAVEENYQYIDFVQRSPGTDLESNDLNMKDDLLPQQNLMSSPGNEDGVTTSNSSDELIEDVPDALSDMCSQRMTSEATRRRILDCQAIHNEKIRGDEENLDSLSMVEHGADLPAFTSSTQDNTNIMKSDHATGRSNVIMRKIIPQLSQLYSKVATQGLNSNRSELNGSKKQPGCVIPKTFRGHSFIVSKSKTKASISSSHLSKPRTWHRTGNNYPTSLPGSKPSVGAGPPKRPILEKKGNFQNTSYVRKGNSLVRKPTQVSALPQICSANQSPPLGLDEFQKSIKPESRIDVTYQPNLLKTGVTNAPMQRERTPSPPIDPKSEENRSSPLAEPPSNGCCQNVSDPRKFIETNDAPNSSEDVLKYDETPESQTGASNDGESQVEVNDGNMSSLNAKKIVYIKPKTNQLVATTNSCDLSAPTDEKAQTAFSDGYYKRSNNQLVRTTFESHINQTVAMPNSTVNSDRQGACKVLCNRRFSKRRSHKVAGSSCKPLRASLVWTLCGKNSSKNDSDSGHYQKVLPHFFPWKRATYLRSFIHNPSSSSNRSSLSAISKKLLLLRKRDTVYTRSTNGFSLWKSKVLGVGGSSLKWSKSIERNSKQANEEATLAVAAVERKKREQKDAGCIGSQAKRERIFRIGSFRYRMDSSRQTLQRISDDESLSSSSIRSGLAAKKAYIPRRLVIGNDEYVRIGNGNQLIRDPKKRTRKLANEKVRWSLHTARQRLARKQKYCQFFTRFGKCNKDDGKCPYIHDPSKIAVCTKFLNGLCSTPNCKLTHKVIPERMPDCSYFLQGLCTNRNCPYRHVSVNPKASICGGFLKGYCADGNECRKKHSYVCPAFEATGTCTQGAKCKLHHPQKQSNGKKRKRSGDQKNSRGRYFGSIPIDVSEPGTMVAPRQRQQNDDLEGEFADYINLDFDEEVAESVDQSFEQATLCDSDPLDSQLDNFDELIKPVLIMKKKSHSTIISGQVNL